MLQREWHRKRLLRLSDVLGQHPQRFVDRYATSSTPSGLAATLTFVPPSMARRSNVTRTITATSATP
jgi:hypothetical protein